MRRNAANKPGKVDPMDVDGELADESENDEDSSNAFHQPEPVFATGDSSFSEQDFVGFS